MFDLDYYSIFAAIKTFGELDSSAVMSYCSKQNKMSIDRLFLEVRATSCPDDLELNNMISMCEEYAEALCTGYGVAYSPIYSAFLIPDYQPKNKSESDEIVRIFESTISIAAETGTPEWYLREAIKYRLVPFCSSDQQKLIALILDISAGKELYNAWISEER